ncbi:MAG: TIGR03435 family protein [Bryobacteraceae bacterium]
MKLTLCALAITLLPVSAASFEVASVRPHISVGDQRIGNRTIVEGVRPTFTGPSVRVTGATLGWLVTFAYDLKPYEIDDRNWSSLKAETFDILAKAEGDAVLTRDQFRPLFQALLAERFHLKFHRETKEMSSLALSLAKTGSKLKSSDPDAKGSMMLKGATMTINAWSMNQLAQYFSVTQGQPVLDRTGLDGRYDFHLTWSETESAYPTLVTALEEQLGLKLEKRREPIQMFIVDSVERPSLD